MASAFLMSNDYSHVFTEQIPLQRQSNELKDFSSGILNQFITNPVKSKLFLPVDSSSQNIKMVCSLFKASSDNRRSSHIHTISKDLREKLYSIHNVSKISAAVSAVEPLWSYGKQNLAVDLRRSLNDMIESKIKGKSVPSSQFSGRPDLTHEKCTQFSQGDFNCFHSRTKIDGLQRDLHDNKALVHGAACVTSVLSVDHITFQNPTHTLDVYVFPRSSQEKRVAVSMTGMKKMKAQMVNTSQSIHPVDYMAHAGEQLHKSAVEIANMHLKSMAIRDILRQRPDTKSVQELVDKQYGRNLQSEETLDAYLASLQKELTKEETATLKNVKFSDVKVLPVSSDVDFHKYSIGKCFVANAKIRVSGIAKVDSRKVVIDNVFELSNTTFAYK